MNFLQLKKLMPSLLKSDISIELVSAPGRGKSEFVRQTVEAMSKASVAAGGKPWGFATAFLATYTPPDLVGYQFKSEREFNGKRYAVTDPSMPLWMMTEEGIPVTEYEHGILFLDEYGQAEPDVKRASAELLLNKKVGPWELPKGWRVIAASNRASDRSGVTKSFDFIINRRAYIAITDDIKSWTDWAEDNGVSPLTLSFANANPQVVFQDGVPEKQRPWCTPRSLVKADNLMQQMEKDGIDVLSKEMLPITTELLAGIIGEGESAQFIAHTKLEREMPRFETIIANPDKVKVPEKPDAQMIICYNLAHRVTVETISPIMKYIQRLPKEFATTFCQSAVKRNYSLATTPAMQKWVMENSSLVASLASTNK